MAWTAADQEAANAGRFLMEGSAVSVRDARRVVASPFLVKTYRLVDDSSTDHIVSWGDHGNNFVVWRPKEFSASVLPLYFKHTKFSSFVRQLNTYGFRKIVRGRCVFTNELFRKGQKHFLSHIQRRKSSSTSTMQPLHIVEYDKSSSLVANSSSTVQDSVVPAAVPSLSEENEILRRNISFLFSEIARMQNICTEISRYLFGTKPGISMDRKKIDNVMYRKMDNLNGSSTITDVGEQININPPELFGVSL